MGDHIRVQFPVRDIYLGICDQPPRSTQPGHPLWLGAMSISQRAVTSCGWGVKAGMVRVWVAGKQGSDTRARTQKNPVGFFGKPT